MKIFIYKVLFVSIIFFFLYQFTIAYHIRKIENKIYDLKNQENIIFLKEKIRKEIEKSLSKERILDEKDAEIIKKFIKKIKKEVE